MDFSVEKNVISDPGLNVEYFLVPWDSKLLEYQVAELAELEIHDELAAGSAFKEFEEWRHINRIRLCSCRTKHHQMLEAKFLQRHNFYFVELNYRPEFRNLRLLKSPVYGGHEVPISISSATVADQPELVQMAGSIFEHGRFHQDPSLGSSIGNKRYANWMRNSFESDHQTVLKCMAEDTIVGFFVVEYSQAHSCHWCLVGLAPGMSGQGIGTRVWSAMMQYHQNEEIDTITTSISSHNTAVFNLYAKLGFRFPPPLVTFHWRN